MKPDADARPRAGHQRYLRHTLIDGFDQDAVAAMDVIVIGAGAVGNEVLKNLCLLGVGRLHVVDLDRIESHNLPKAVLFRDSDLGRGKAEVAAGRCAELDPNVAVDFAEGDFRDVLGLARLRRASAVVCCVDNLEARLALSRRCQLAGVPLVNTAIDSRSAVVERYPFERTRADTAVGATHATVRACACYACTLPASAYARLRERYACGWLRKAALVERTIPTTIVTSSIAGALAAAEVLELLRSPSPEARRTFVDTRTAAMSRITLAPDPDCLACADAPARVVLTRANRSSALRSDPSMLPAAPPQIGFAEPMVLDVACQACEARVAIDAPARHHDESLAYCPACRMRSRAVNIVERLPLAEFVARYRDRPVPGGFLRLDHGDTAVLIELE